MKALLVLADGFEDTEGLTTRDVLRRGGIEVTTTSISDSKVVTTSFGVTIFCETLISEISYKDFDIIVLPGGGQGTMRLMRSDKVKELVKKFAQENKLVCAICAAPMVLGACGLLKGKRFTCFAGCDKGIDGIFTANEVEVDGNIITARSMAYSIPFALAIIEKMLGKEERERVLKGLRGLDAK